MPITEMEVELIKEPGFFIPIDVHGEPVHGDEMLAIDIIACEATRAWFEENKENGRIKIGLGQKGKFSDKKYIHYGFRKEESSVIKVARSLRLLDKSRWKKMLSYINQNDIRGSANNIDLPSIVKFWQLQKQGSAFDAFEWFAIGSAVKRECDNGNANLTITHIAELMRRENVSRKDVDVDEWLKKGQEVHRKHQEFFQKAREELSEKNSQGKVLRRKIFYKGQVIQVAAINSDNYRMHVAMRYKAPRESQFAHVIIVKNSLGNVLVSYDKKYNVNLKEVLAVLRYVEQKFQKKIVVKSWDQLRVPGTHQKIKEWFYNINMEPDMIHSTDSHGNPSTKLNLQQTFNCVLIGLDEKRFHPDPKVSSLCEDGLCKYGHDCLNLQCGLPRCRRIYYGAKNRNFKK